MRKIRRIAIALIALILLFTQIVFAADTTVTLAQNELVDAQAVFDLARLGEDAHSYDFSAFRDGIFYTAYFEDGQASVYTYTDTMEKLCEIPFPENCNPYHMSVDQDRNVVFYNLLRASEEEEFSAELLIYDGEALRVSVQLPEGIWGNSARSFHAMGEYYVVDAFDKIIILNKDGEVVSAMDSSYFTLTTDDENIYGFVEGLQQVEALHFETGEKIIIPYPPGGEDIYLERLFVDDQNIYAYCYLGVVAYNFETKTWTRIIPHDAILFPSGSFDNEVREIFYGNGKVYVNSRELKQDGYVYRNHVFAPADENALKKKLTIAAACSVFYIQPAMYQYQLDHPDVQVEYRTLMDEGGLQWPSSHFTDYPNMQDFLVRQSDAIMTLNTELLGSDDIDIIILDGLPMHRYIENGLLYDLSEWADGRQQNGEWISGIATAYMQDDGSFPALPLSASVDVLLGDTETIESISNFAALGEYAKQLQEGDVLWSPIYNQDVPSTIVKFFPVLADTFMDENGELDFLSDAFIYYLDTCKAIQNRLVGNSMHNMATEKQLQYEDQFLQGDIVLHSSILNTNPEVSMGFLDVLAYQGKEAGLISLPNASGRNYFYPNQVVGVTQKSQNKDIALDFLNELTSETVMQMRLNEYIPLHQAALEYNLTPAEQGSSGAYYEYGTEGVSIPAVYIDEALKGEILDFASSLDTPVGSEYDFQFLSMLYEETLPFIEGEISAEEAAQALTNRTNIYLSE